MNQLVIFIMKKIKKIKKDTNSLELFDFQISA